MTIARLALLSVMVLSLPAMGQESSSDDAVEKQASHWFRPEYATAKMLILGTFHFKDAGLDSYKPEVGVEILSETRQKELGKILDQLAEFNPTKILIEVKADREAEFNERFSQYLAGEYELGSNEIYQVAFKLAKRLGHQRLYAVDASGRRYKDLPSAEEYAEEHGQAFPVADSWSERFMEAYGVEDRAKAERTLSEHLLFLNSEEQLRFSHGHYVLSYLAMGESEEYPAADHVTGWWYNRNLRILGNIYRVMEPDDRLLLLIGAGHVPIIRHAAAASPEIDLIDVTEVLR
jgi:hypothetical protein